MKKNIAILGGGISGLSAAFLLLKKIPGITVHLYEKTDSVGGALSSHKLHFRENSWLELGPSSIRKSKQINELMKIISETDLLPKIIGSIDYPQVYLYYDEKMRVFPRGYKPTTLFRFAMDNKKFISSFLKPTINKITYSGDSSQDCSIKDLIEKKTRWGFLEFKELRQHLHQISGALFNGIYASDISELSGNICWNKCHHDAYYSNFFQNKEYKELEAETQKMVDQYLPNSSSFSFTNGLNSLPQGILSFLKNKYPENFKIRKNEEIFNLDLNSSVSLTVNASEKYDKVISALPLNNLLQIMQQSKTIQSSKVLTLLESIKFKSLARINFYFDKDVIPNNLKSFGFLILPKENEEILGMTFDSKIFPLNSNETRCSIMIGNEVVEKNEFNEEKLIKIAEQYLEKRLEIRENPKEVKIMLWKNFMPVFGIGHYEKIINLLEELHSLNKHFKITGNFIFSAAIPEIVLFNHCLVESLKNEFKE